MKKFLLPVLFLVAFAQAALAVAPNVNPGLPGLPNPSTIKFIMNRGFGAQAYLGTQLTDHKIQLAKGVYDFGRTGGASVVLPSTVLANLQDADGKDLRLPYHAVIRQVTVDVASAFAASATAGFTAPLLGVGLNTAGDLVPYTAVASFTGILAGTPVGTAATMVKVGSAAKANKNGSVVGLNMKGGSIIKGRANVFIEYYLSD